MKESRKDDRPAPVRLTNKSLFILDNLKKVQKKVVKNKIIEEALSQAYPLFSEIYNKEQK